MNKGILFSILYFFFAFPWPMKLGGVYHPWWEYVSTFVQIILGGIFFFFLFRYLSSLSLKKENVEASTKRTQHGP